MASAFPNRGLGTQRARTALQSYGSVHFQHRDVTIVIAFIRNTQRFRGRPYRGRTDTPEYAQSNGSDSTD
jgi:hypothetical protein